MARHHVGDTAGVARRVSELVSGKKHLAVRSHTTEQRVTDTTTHQGVHTIERGETSQWQATYLEPRTADGMSAEFWKTAKPTQQLSAALNVDLENIIEGVRLLNVSNS